MSTTPYRAYWNDEAIERCKPFWIEDASDQKLLRYLRVETNLERCFRNGLAFVERELGGIGSRVLDLGAGVCWTSAILSCRPEVARVDAVDCSEHRLFKLAPLVLAQYQAEDGKIVRHLGEMADVPVPAGSVDLAVFCQALYMSDRPVEMLARLRPLLRPGGVVMVSCEAITRPTARWRRLARRLRHAWRGLRDRRARRPLEARPDASGRHGYVDAQYRRFLVDAGYRLRVQALDYAVFPYAPAPTMNYFGVNDPDQARPPRRRREP